MSTKVLKSRVSGGKTAPEPVLTQRPIDKIHPYSGNPRTHTPKQVRQIADSISEFGFTNPILVDEDGSIIAGHGRLLAARHLGMADVPVISFRHLSRVQKKALLIADNRLAEKGSGWDRAALALEFEAIAELDADFDLELTGFDLEEIELIGDAALNLSNGNKADEDVPALCGPAITKAGDRA